FEIRTLSGFRQHALAGRHGTAASRGLQRCKCRAGIGGLAARSRNIGHFVSAVEKALNELTANESRAPVNEAVTLGTLCKAAAAGEDKFDWNCCRETAQCTSPRAAGF
ncbi:MAG TPA: hypothetical protein VFA65_16190, partial [Bryobacteraceae bacterium]|nr:hypothetical protein [Bryobacteraceae bacterium]